MFKREYIWLGIEAFFVLMAMILLKIWIFPFFISIWFPTGDLSSQMFTWTMLIMAVMTCFIYLGLGSQAKYLYRLSHSEAIFFFLLFHLLFYLPNPYLESVQIHWLRLGGDLIFLFSLQPVPFSLQWVVFFYLLFFQIGRSIQVLENQKGRRGNWLRSEIERMRS
ncbi:hypothetical protein [Thermoflavimicrobium dichotomicum]|uniref:Uncharacterized protein n=1 Tax=Thermoflavimicrobium dichotomicum TaxID=46223 RepID=A0A1I3SMI9_9BACL|nr:hypothetical protein [Thermoflavimicrobium dichotomicum]SFJ58646.1 hypothetical protein SAMN05421852_11360 [Thermoflavimicrobium dichotomicum]